MPLQRVRKTLLLLAAPLTVAALLILPALLETPFWQIVQTHSFRRSPATCMRECPAFSCIELEDDSAWHRTLLKRSVMRFRYETSQQAVGASGYAITEQQVETYAQDFQRRLQHLQTDRKWFEVTSVGHLWMLFSAVWPCAPLERIGAVMDGGAAWMPSHIHVC
jgi:hypothetical protein